MTIAEFIARNRGNRKALLLIVYIALFLDNMLLTTVGQFFKSFSSLYTSYIYLNRGMHAYTVT